MYPTPFVKDDLESCTILFFPKTGGLNMVFPYYPPQVLNKYDGKEKKLEKIWKIGKIQIKKRKKNRKTGQKRE